MGAFIGEQGSAKNGAGEWSAGVEGYCSLVETLIHMEERLNQFASERASEEDCTPIRGMRQTNGASQARTCGPAERPAGHQLKSKRAGTSAGSKQNSLRG